MTADKPKIEKGVPIPRSATKRWPFAEMEVGDSIFSVEQKIVSAAHSWAASNRKKVATRKVDGGFRAWRIA